MAGGREQPWRKWLDAAINSLDAAYFLEQHGFVRSSASRAYYASYQAATALLLYCKQVPPTDREAWSHDVTPDLIQKLPTRFWRQDKRNLVASRLGDLYKLRIRADYKFGSDADAFVLDDTLKSASYIVRTIVSILVNGK